MCETVTTDNPRTVAACPECDGVGVRTRPTIAAKGGKQYRCPNCTALFDEYIERASRKHRARRLHEPGVPIKEEFRGRGEPPERVYVSIANAERYHREDCPRGPENASTRRLDIVRAWGSFEPCRYCIGDDPVSDTAAREAPADD